MKWTNVMKFFLAALFLLTLSNRLMAQETIPLYKEIPNSKPTPTDYKEYADTTADGVIIIHKVSVPNITIYKPEHQDKDGSAVVICPGGGYAILAYNLEGTTVAKILNSWGVTAVVLKYRLPSEEIMEDKSIGPLQDAQRALQYTREHASELNLNPKKIGIMGFSAGGHLAASASTLFDHSYIANAKNTSLRPDFSILGYPVISFTDSLAHMGSRENLIGKDPSKETIEKFSNELQVNKNTPPAFLVLAADDKVVKPDNSIAYFNALLKNNVAAEMHIFQNGGHGFGTHLLAGNNWMDLLKNWMIHNGYLSAE
ncbi:MAG: alpha/beta hydrolase [Ginsengibacter sp.]